MPNQPQPEAVRMPIERAIGMRRPARRDCGNWYLVADADAIFEALETELQTERAAHERTRAARDADRLYAINEFRRIGVAHDEMGVLVNFRAEKAEAELESVRAEVATAKGTNAD